MAQSERVRNTLGRKTLFCKTVFQNSVSNLCFQTVILGTQNLINAALFSLNFNDLGVLIHGLQNHQFLLEKRVCSDKVIGGN